MIVVNPASTNSFVNQNRLHLVSVALSVALGGFLLGFGDAGLSGTGGNPRLGFRAFPSYGLLILATLPFVVYVLRNQQQTAVILKRLPRPQRRLPSAGAKQ
jgi:hypothetical protein